MKQEQITLRCEDGQEAVVFHKYTFKTLVSNYEGKDSIKEDIDYEINIEDNYIGGDYKGFFGRIKRAWRAFRDKPVVYTGIYCEDKDKMKKFLTDCLNLVEDKSYMPTSQAINLLFHIANNINKVTDVEEEQEVYLQAIEKAIEALSNNDEQPFLKGLYKEDDSVISNEELIKKGEW